MQTRHIILGLLILCICQCIYTSAARDVPISKLPNSKALMCETCQALVYWQHNELQSAIKTKSSWKGGIEVAIESMLETQRASQDGSCPFNIFASFAKTSTPRYDIGHMMRACTHLLTDYTDDLIELLAAGYAEDAIRRKLCLHPKICSVSDLWTESQLPINRPGTTQYNTRVGELYRDRIRNNTSSDELERGYTETTSGILYKPVHSGSENRKPTLTDRIRARYVGWLVNGTQFDGSDQEFKGTGAEFPVQGVIPGWTEMLLDMQVGERRRIVIPPHLGYGVNGVGTIGPNSTLIFDMQLLQILGKSEYVRPDSEMPEFTTYDPDTDAHQADPMSPPSVHEEL